MIHHALQRLRRIKKQYPYRSEPGNVTVLGPETFIDQDGLVICHKGANYYRPVMAPPPKETDHA
jgi:hypothetical protein